MFQKLVFLSLLFVSFCGWSQTLDFKLMAYNLLHYPGNNSMSDSRYNDFGSIVHYAQADIIATNELYDTGDARGADSLLIKGLNTGGINYYQRSNMLTPNNGLNNMLFYNTQKFTLYKHIEINTIYRNLDHYTLYVNDPNLGCSRDTVFFDVIVGHLKAGNTSADATSRATMAQDLINHINTIPTIRNIVFAGDCNFYSTNTNEPAYGIITNTANTIPLIDVLGNTWLRDNVNYVGYYTQSTRGSVSPYLGGNGGATGGLDDRFDYIFMGNNVKDGTQDIDYLEGSYHPIGNDGAHYNISILQAPANTDVPANIAQNLFNMSDHYPVITNLRATLSAIIANPLLAAASVTQTYIGANANLIVDATLNANEQIEWYNNPTLTGAPLFIGANYTPLVTGTSYTYYATIRNTLSGCTSASKLTVQVNGILPLLTLSSFSTLTTCPNSAANLIVDATLNANEQIEWYNNPTLTGAPLFIGANYTPLVTGTYTYYVTIRNTLSGYISGQTLAVTVDTPFSHLQWDN